MRHIPSLARWAARCAREAGFWCRIAWLTVELIVLRTCIALLRAALVVTS